MSRTTRSASRELGETEADIRTKKPKRSQAVREGSADSVGSAASVDGKGGRRRKNARAPVPVAAGQYTARRYDGSPANTLDVRFVNGGRGARAGGRNRE